MGVAQHLNIKVEEYDGRIRTFIPSYEEMIGTAAEALGLLRTSAPTIVDLGIGTGALAARCLAVRPDALLVGVDADPAMLETARARLAGHPRLDLVQANFLDFPLPGAAAIVASLALHHVRTADAKAAFYASCARAIEPGGVLVTADCLPARDPVLASLQREVWQDHLLQTYPADEVDGYFAAWAGEDVYFPLEDEVAWLARAGLAPEVVWRKGSFAVVVAIKA